MHLILRVRRTCRLMPILALAALVPVVGRAQNLETRLLDLTKRVPQEEQLGRVPGISVGGIGGQNLPRGYPLQIRVELRSISPQPLRLGKKFTVDVSLQNAGSSVFLLPASQNSVTVLKQGNKARRSFLFALLFVQPLTGQQISSVVAVAVASETVPGSMLRVEPGQKVRVLFTGDLESVSQWLKSDLSTIQIRAQVSEWTSEDARYFVKSESQRAVSNNAIVATLR